MELFCIMTLVSLATVGGFIVGASTEIKYDDLFRDRFENDIDELKKSTIDDRTNYFLNPYFLSRCFSNINDDYKNMILKRTLQRYLTPISKTTFYDQPYILYKSFDTDDTIILPKRKYDSLKSDWTNILDAENILECADMYRNIHSTNKSVFYNAYENCVAKKKEAKKN